MKIKKGETYPAFVKRVRMAAKLTQEEFAARLGYHTSTVSAWERGRNVPVFTQRVIDDFAKTIK